MDNGIDFGTFPLGNGVREDLELFYRTGRSALPLTSALVDNDLLAAAREHNGVCSWQELLLAIGWMEQNMPHTAWGSPTAAAYWRETGGKDCN